MSHLLRSKLSVPCPVCKAQSFDPCIDTETPPMTTQYEMGVLDSSEVMTQALADKDSEIEGLQDTVREMQIALAVRDRWIALMEQTIAQGGITVQARPDLGLLPPD